MALGYCTRGLRGYGLGPIHLRLRTNTIQRQRRGSRPRPFILEISLASLDTRSVSSDVILVMESLSTDC